MRQTAVGYNMVKKIFILGMILVSFLNCKEENTDKKPKERFRTEEDNKEFNSSKAAVLYELSLELYEKRNYNKAIGVLKSALLIEKNPIIYNELGVIYSTIEHFDEASEYYSQGQKIDSTYYPIFINDAHLKIQLREFDSAAIPLKKVIKQSKSEYWKAYANLYLAILYYQNDRQCEKAFEYFSKARALKNDQDLKKMYEYVETTIKEYCS